jgi:hypothetical protein
VASFFISNPKDIDITTEQKTIPTTTTTNAKKMTAQSQHELIRNSNSEACDNILNKTMRSGSDRTHIKSDRGNNEMTQHPDEPQGVLK